MRSVVVLLIIAALAFAMCSEKPVEENKGTEEEGVFNTTVGEEYFVKLRQIIESNASSKEKEDAILKMAQFAVMLNDSERAIRYLKDVAMTSKDEIVVAASYAAIDLIRDYYPPEAIGEMVVNVDGDLKPGSTVKATATVKAYRDCLGAVGIKRLPSGLELASPLRYKFNLSAGESKEFVFEFTPQKSGDYYLRISAFLSEDRFDYQEIEQKILLRISSEGGEAVYLSE